MKRKILTSIIIVSAGLFVTSIGLGVGLSFINQQHYQESIKNPIGQNDKVSFDNQTFNNIDSAYQYALNKLEETKFNATNHEFYSLSNNNAINLFNSPSELNQYVNSQIKVIENCLTNEINHNLDPVDNSIYVNELHKYNIDVSTNQTFNNNYDTIYRKNGGGFVIANGLNNRALKEAKKSYLEIHEGFFFNGIYFKSKQDLEIYLRNVYTKQFVNSQNNQVNNDKYKKIYYYDENRRLFSSEPIDFSSENINLNSQIANFLNTNAFKYLKVKDTEHNINSYLKYNSFDGTLIGDIGSSVSIGSLPILKKANNDNKSLYVVDANLNEKYDLYGPYFLNTDANISSITNPEMWTKSNDKPYEIVRSQSIELLSSFLDLFLNQNQKINPSLKTHEPLFLISNFNNELYKAEETLMSELSQINTTYSSNLLKDVIDFKNNLMQTKSYCSLYSIVTIYNFIYDRLISFNASVECVIAFQTYFDILIDVIQSIFESIFGDLLKPFNNPNGKKFNFGEFFGINQFGFDGSNIGSVLNGYDLIRDYKPLVAGCYVFMKAIGNSQNIAVPNYDSSTDDYLFQLLEDGKNADQNTKEKVKKLFIENNICSQLNSIYKTFSNWSSIINNDLYENLDNIPNQNVNEKLDNLINYVNNVKTNENIPTQVYDDFIQLQEIVNVDSKYRINKQRNEDSFTFILKTSFIQKRKTNLEFKIESLKNSKSFINRDFSNSWTSSDGIFSENKFQWNKMSSNLSESIKISSSKEIIEESSFIQQVSVTKNKTLFEKFEIAEKVLGNVKDIANSITKLITDVNNDKFNDVEGEIIATGVVNICSSLFDGISQVTPPPVNVIVKAASMVFSFISGAIGTAEQVVYEYVVNDSTNPIKYYWDGGLVMKRFWGLWNDEKRTIKDLQMQSPQLIITNQNKDVLYFDRKTYPIEDGEIVKKQAINYVLNTLNSESSLYNELSSRFNWVYSLESNAEKVNETNSFRYILSQDENENSLTKYILNGNNVAKLEGSDLFVDGYHFNSITDLENNLMKNVVDVIKPVYIAKLPALDANNIPLKNQEKYHLPYPYFEPANIEDEQLICSKDKQINAEVSVNTKTKNEITIKQDQEYITYDSNIDNTVDKNNGPSLYAATNSEIFANIQERFINSFDVESKVVLKTNLVNNSYQKFDDFDTNLQTLDIYYVELNPGEIKYFINKLDAENYILKKGTAHNNNSVKVNLLNKTLYHFIDFKNNNLYFENKSSFNEWFVKNTTKVNI